MIERNFQYAILPGKGSQGTPCPELLTEEEAIRYLRLDTIGLENPSATLRRYREKGILRGTQVSRKIFYLRVELDRFLMRITETNPR
ncbi:MAG: helix-turn-helix domain-containing protein [Sedimentisphaerales bacterium]|nr:helix-turn-helix domain-containing protein [Sedimentisphaerales bacterium]